MLVLHPSPLFHYFVKVWKKGKVEELILAAVEEIFAREEANLIKIGYQVGSFGNLFLGDPEVGVSGWSISLHLVIKGKEVDIDLGMFERTTATVAISEILEEIAEIKASRERGLKSAIRWRIGMNHGGCSGLSEGRNTRNATLEELRKEIESRSAIRPFGSKSWLAGSRDVVDAAWSRAISAGSAARILRSKEPLREFPRVALYAGSEDPHYWVLYLATSSRQVYALPGWNEPLGTEARRFVKKDLASFWVRTGHDFEKGEVVASLVTARDYSGDQGEEDYPPESYPPTKEEQIVRLPDGRCHLVSHDLVEDKMEFLGEVPNSPRGLRDHILRARRFARW